MRRVAPCFALASFVLAVSCEQSAPSSSEDDGPGRPGPVEIPDIATLRITHINVGQGDSTLIEGPSATLLVDAGDNGMGNDRVVRVLNENGIAALDYVVTTHPHADHIGGMDEVLTSVDATGGVFDNGDNANTQAYDNYAGAAAATTGGRRTITPGHVFELGGGAKATCYAVNGVVIDGYEVFDATSTNDRSVVLLIEWGEFKYVIAGDLGGYDTDTVADVESSIGWVIGDVDVLRASHHGSRYSTNPKWLNDLKPEVVVISAGNGNDYGHPAADTLDRLTGADPAVTIPAPDVFLTEKGAAPSPFTGSGDVVILARPSSYRVENSTYSAVGH